MIIRAIALTWVLLFAFGGCASAVERPADLTQLSVVDAAQLIRERKVTSAELTQAYLARAEANRDLNAYITLDRAGALAAAQTADAELAAGRVKGALHGVPLVVKDNTHVAGLPNSAATPALRGFVPKGERADRAEAGGRRRGHPGQDQHARAGLRHLRLQRGVLHRPADRDPQSVRPQRASPAAARAAPARRSGGRLAPGGLGSDTGGSVRVPAALTGGAGLRPTILRYSQEGVTPIAHSRDTVGPMAQTVADVALLDSVITGRRAAVARVAERREARRVSGVLLQGPGRRHHRPSPRPRSRSSGRPGSPSSRWTCRICRS